MDADFLLAQRREAAEADRATKEQRDIERQLVIDTHTFTRLEKIISNPDVEWFLKSFMVPLVAAEKTAALDIKSSAEKRNEHAHRHDLGMKLLTLLTEKHEEFRAKTAIPIDD